MEGLEIVVAVWTFIAVTLLFYLDRDREERAPMNRRHCWHFTRDQRCEYEIQRLGEFCCHCGRERSRGVIQPKEGTEWPSRCGAD